MTKEECWTRAYCAALQAYIGKRQVLDEQDRKSMADFCSRAASDAANAFSTWFHK